MLLKNTINKFFQSTNEKILEKRFKASKVTFIIFVFLFFLHYFFIGVGFYSEILLPFLSISYSLLLISFFFYLFFFGKNFITNKIGIGVFYVFFLFLIVVFLLLFLPVFVQGGIFSLLK